MKAGKARSISGLIQRRGLHANAQGEASAFSGPNENQKNHGGISRLPVIRIDELVALTDEITLIQGMSLRMNVRQICLANGS